MGLDEPILDLQRFSATPLKRDPFDYLIVPGFVRPAARDALHADFPAIGQPGSFPLETVSYGPAFERLTEELMAPALDDLFGEKFGLDLAQRPRMMTVRGICDPADGRIHTDSATKIITVLIYLNESWDETGGRLRLLHGGGDLGDYAAEVEPAFGTLLAFRRSDRSFHGHAPFTGARKVVQLNWVRDKAVVRRERRRHRLSALGKRLNPFARAPSSTGSNNAGSKTGSGAPTSHAR